MPKKKQETNLSTEAIAALRASDFDGSTFTLTQENLACYSEVKALVGALGGRWVSGRKRHEFGEGVDAKSLILTACDRGSIPASNPHDFYPTPVAVAEAMVKDESVESGLFVLRNRSEPERRPVRFLEPNGGSGSLVRALVNLMEPGDELVVVEVNPLMAAALRVQFPMATVIEGDFLSYRPEQGFDVVLMNPPFAGKTYAKHVLHAFGMLNKFGVLSAVVPSAFLHHGDEFLYRVAEAGYWLTLGAGQFEGTSVDTSVLWMTNDPANKWREVAYNGHTNHHAWNVSVSVSSDRRTLEKLERAGGFEEAFAILKAWASAELKNQNAVRVDEAIAMEALRDMAEGYEFPGLAHLLASKSGQVGQLEFGVVAA